ncbi:MAG: fimbrillin family protein, partial [Bacteroidales bacterium]|nr:fimbrillin family protein [Bacteroidales bacterium]
MKKLMFLAAVAIAAVACSKTYQAEPVSEQAIGFGTWTETLTKARGQASNTFTNGDDFAVYGYKLNGETKNVVFKKDGTNNVVSTTNGTTWTYSPKRFWDRSATSYTFYAISPAEIGDTPAVVEMEEETGTISEANRPIITFNGNDNDILVADETTVLKTTFTGNPVPKVNLKFNHITSLVDFKVKKSTDLNGVTVDITSFYIDKIDNAGKFAVTNYTTSTPTSTPKPTIAWTASSQTGKYYNNAGTSSNKHGVEEVALPTNIPSAKASAPYLIKYLVAMPQTFRTSGDAIQIAHIEYTIKDTYNNVSTFSYDVPLHQFDKVDDTDNKT